MIECDSLSMNQRLEANQIAVEGVVVVLSHNRRVVSVADALNGNVIWMSTAA